MGMHGVSAPVGFASVLMVLFPQVSLGDVLLAANFSRYPTYQGQLAVTGTVNIAGHTSDAGIGQVLSWDLAGTDPTCGFADVTGIPNACGIHVHVGRNCSDASTLGGHYWNFAAITADPWQTTKYATTNGKASGQGLVVITGVTAKDLFGRAFLVHDATGARVACSRMAPVATQTPAAKNLRSTNRESPDPHFSVLP